MKKLILIPALLFTLTACDLIENFHEVHEGKYYRSRQLTKKQMRDNIKQHGIKTVINLRGVSDGKWYKEEKAVVEGNGAILVDIRMGASRLPHREHLIALLDTFKNAPRPILVHCKAGADRTGEASAIYQMLYMGKSKEEALEMLTLKYFHLEQAKPAKRYFIRDLWQGEEWARNEYNPCSGQYEYYDVNNEFCKGSKDAWEKENWSDDNED